MLELGGCSGPGSVAEGKLASVRLGHRRAPHRYPLGGSAAAVFLVAALGWSAEMHRPQSVEGSIGSRVVSPAVVATWVVRREPQGTRELELLVLWRGNPGCFMRAGSNGSSGSVSSGSAGDESDRGIVVEQLSYGGIVLDLEFDRTKRTVRVQDHDVILESTNVILVDEVDGATGPQIAGSLRVDPLFPAEPGEIEVIIRGNPEIYSFLKCDAKVSDTNAQSMIDAVCEQMKPR
jgi:hypothetical protein